MVRSGVHILWVTKSKRKNFTFSQIAEKCFDVLEDYFPRKYCTLDQDQYATIRAAFKRIRKTCRQESTAG